MIKKWKEILFVIGLVLLFCLVQSDDFYVIEKGIKSPITLRYYILGIILLIPFVFKER